MSVLDGLTVGVLGGTGAHGRGLVHARLGHEELSDVDMRTRRDVDTVAQLASARSLGVAPVTGRVWAGHAPNRGAAALASRDPGTKQSARSLVPAAGPAETRR